MNLVFSPAKRRIFRGLAWASGVGAFLLAASGWLGWFLGLDFLKSISTEWVPMKPLTSVGLGISGLLLILSVSPARRFFSIPLATLGGTFLILLGGAVLAQYLTGLDFGFDTLFFKKEVLLVELPHPGRMSPSSAFCFILVGLAFWAGRPTQIQKWLAGLQALAVSVMGIGLFPLVGYWADILFGYQDWIYTGMAMHTAVAFVLIGTGLFLKACSEGELAWYLDRLTTVGFVAGVILMIVAVNMAHHFAMRMERMSTSVAHRQNVLREIQHLAAELSDLESSQRGYIITGNESLLVKRPENEERARQKVFLLRRETLDNPVQQKNLEELAELIRQKNRSDELATAERKERGFPTTSRMEAIGAGMALWQKIRLQFGKMRNEEYRLLAQDQADVEAASTLTFLLLPFGAFLSLTLISGGVFFLNAGMGKRFRAEELLQASILEGRKTEEIVREREKQLSSITANLPGLVAQLDGNLRYLFANATYEKWLGIPVRNIVGRSMAEVIGEEAFKRAEPQARRALAGERVDFENTLTTIQGEKMNMMVAFLPDWGDSGKVKGVFVVAMDITRLKNAEEEILKLNAGLEQRVASRTAELEMANKELEAFSYSVSHDLRAPLRTVDGFSQALVEDCGENLSKEGRRYLHLVREGAQRMGNLIDDLLTFSRLSRLPLSRDRVNMKWLVEESLAELGLEGLRANRSIELVVDTLPAGEGDATLLKQVWINLISNALKYTRKCETTRIEIGSRPEGKNLVYYIRDNGTGFDMRYAGKLFGVFQRLHRAEDYEGTGVGLAIVQRVVHRHGGKVWAESKPGEGASFYFTLGEQIL